MKWQPIETAPIESFDKEKWFMRHSPNLILWNGHYHVIGSFGYTQKGKGRWTSESGRIIYRPTHWQPLPEPPEE